MSALNFIKWSYFLSTLLTLLSCISEGGRPGTVQRFAEDSMDTLCQDVYDLTSFSCEQTCRSTNHIASDDEREQTLVQLDAALEQENITSEQYQEIIDDINSAENGLCIAGSEILRPSDAIFIHNDFCACKNSQPDIVNDCASFCSLTSDENSTLYGTVRLTSAVLSNPALGSLERWCNAEIPESTLTSPGCFLEVTDKSTTESLAINLTPNGDNFTVNIESLNYETIYLASIVESQSGSNARTSTFQIYKKRFDPTEPIGPLKIMPVSQYSCITRQATEIDQTIDFERFARIHFYFASNTSPSSLPPDTKTTICHDINLYGNDDSPLYPRLELISQQFALWDIADIRFTLNDSGQPSINDEIERLLQERTNTTRELSIFNVINWPNVPTIADLEERGPPPMGLFMLPWINPQSGRPFCPTQEDYNGNDPIFNILKEIVGVNTEGLYLAESEPISQSNNNSVRDIIIIREGLLTKIWFYYENYQHLIPDELTSNSKTIHFYWPADIDDPYIKKSTQTIYTIRYPTDIGRSDITSGLTSTIKPTDKRFGCAPALD